MGNLVGSIAFTRSPKDNEILLDLIELMKNYGLVQASFNSIPYDDLGGTSEDTNYFGVCPHLYISQIYDYSDRIKAFLYDASNLIEEYNYIVVGTIKQTKLENGSESICYKKETKKVYDIKIKTNFKII